MLRKSRIGQPYYRIREQHEKARRQIRTPRSSYCSLHHCCYCYLCRSTSSLTALECHARLGDLELLKRAHCLDAKRNSAQNAMALLWPVKVGIFNTERTKRVIQYILRHQWLKRRAAGAVKKMSYWIYVIFNLNEHETKPSIMFQLRWTTMGLL